MYCRCLYFGLCSSTFPKSGVSERSRDVFFIFCTIVALIEFPFISYSQAAAADDVKSLVDRIKALEQRNKPSVSSIRRDIIRYASRTFADFDKYKALDKVEQLKNIARENKDKRSDYYANVFSMLVARINKPDDQFKSYILSLVGDKDYEKIVDSVAKIDKNYPEDKRSGIPSLFSVNPFNTRQFPNAPRASARNRATMRYCYICSAPDHLANRCPRRFSPYHQRNQKNF